jgi:nitroimidazol reductase NimA-like FMN-containing flavoprotein (pyridoxamine 5'-phosphate oxidase superfamily)
MEHAHPTEEEMSGEEMERLLKKARYGRLGLAFENESYVVPVSHLFDGTSIRFHIATKGKKTTYIQANPEACFQVDEWTEQGWGSVICYGTVTLSDSIEAKRDFVKLSGEAPVSDEQLEHMSMFVCTLAIGEMTGRKSPGYVP